MCIWLFLIEKIRDKAKIVNKIFQMYDSMRFWPMNNHRDEFIVQVPHEQKYFAIKMERQSVCPYVYA